MRVVPARAHGRFPLPDPHVARRARMETFTDQRGFTVVELLVVVAIIGMMMAGIFYVERQGEEAYLLGAARVETQQNARVALDMMTRELRSAARVTAIAGSRDVTFVDEYGRSIEYALSGTTLNRIVAGTTTSLIGGVESLTITCYSTYDVAGVTYATTSDPLQVKVITIKLETEDEGQVAAGLPGDQHAIMESTVMLRETLS
jgi:prepilin-type N-terminal cleavage/methylation domain-containing protein